MPLLANEAETVVTEETPPATQEAAEAEEAAEKAAEVAEGKEFATDVPEEKVSAEAQPYLDIAVNIAYGENSFPQMVQMFKEAGPQGFPKAMGTAVVTTMGKLEAETGEELSNEILAEVGTNIFMMITEDIVTSGEVEGITPEIITVAMNQAIEMWAQMNPERFDQAEFQQAVSDEMEAAGGPALEPVVPAGPEVLPGTPPGVPAAAAPVAAPLAAPLAAPRPTDIPEQNLLGGG